MTDIKAWVDMGLEPDARIGVNLADDIQISQAISLKRIADALERLAPATSNSLFKPDGTPNSIVDIARQEKS